MASMAVLNGFRQCTARGEMTPKILWIYFYHSFTRHENTSAVILFCERTGNVFENFIHIHEYCFGLCASKSTFFILLNVGTAIYCTYCADKKTYRLNKNCILCSSSGLMYVCMLATLVDKTQNYLLFHMCVCACVCVCVHSLHKVQKMRVKEECFASIHCLSAWVISETGKKKYISVKFGFGIIIIREYSTVLRSISVLNDK
jgi:hypothetical protein